MVDSTVKYSIEIAVPFTREWKRSPLYWDSRDMAQLSALLDPEIKGASWRVVEVQVVWNAGRSNSVIPSTRFEGEPTVTYTGTTGGSVRFRQYKKDPLPPWAVDIRDELSEPAV